MRACRGLLGSRHLHHPPLSSLLLCSPLTASLRQPLFASPHLTAIPIRTIFEGIRRGDWKCGDCDAINFYKRTECAKCTLPKDQVVVEEYEDHVVDEHASLLLNEALTESFPPRITENKLCALMAYKKLTLSAAEKLYRRANAYPLPVDSRFYKRAAKAFARIGSLENLSQVARDVGTGTEHSGYVLAQLTVELLLRGNLDSALAVLKKMSAYNVKVERARLKNIYIEAARIPNAIEKIRDLKLSFGDDAMLGGITIGQKIKSGLYEAVEMFAASAPNVDIVLATQLLDKSIEGFEQARKGDQKLLYKDSAMKVIGVVSQYPEEIKADATWYLQVVSAMQALGATEQIKLLWESIKNTKDAISFQLCFHIVHLLSLPDLEEVMWEMIELLSECRLINVVFFEEIVSKFAAVGNLDMASNLINKMTSYNILPDNRFVSRYLAALPLPGNVEAVEGANTSMRNLASQGFVIKSRVYENIVNGYINLQMLDKAVDVMLFAFEAKQSESGIDPYVYHVLLDKLIKEDKRDLVLTVYKAVLKSGNEIPGNLARAIFRMHPDMLQIEKDFETVINKPEAVLTEKSYAPDLATRLKTKKDKPAQAHDRLKRKFADKAVSKSVQVAQATSPPPSATHVDFSKYSEEELIGYLQPKDSQQSEKSQQRKYLPETSAPRLPMYTRVPPSELIKHLLPPGTILQAAGESSNLQVPHPQFDMQPFHDQNVDPNLTHHTNLQVSMDQMHNTQMPINLQPPTVQMPTNLQPPNVQMPDLQSQFDIPTSPQPLQTYNEQILSSNPPLSSPLSLLDAQLPNDQMPQPPSDDTFILASQIANLQMTHQIEDPQNADLQTHQQSNFQPTNPTANFQALVERTAKLQTANLQTASPQKKPTTKANEKRAKKPTLKQNQPPGATNTPEEKMTTQIKFQMIPGIPQLPITIKRIKQRNEKKEVTVVDFGVMRLYNESDIRKFKNEYGEHKAYLAHLSDMETQEKEQNKQKAQQTRKEQTEEQEEQKEEKEEQKEWIEEITEQKEPTATLQQQQQQQQQQTTQEAEQLLEQPTKQPDQDEQEQTNLKEEKREEQQYEQKEGEGAGGEQQYKSEEREQREVPSKKAVRSPSQRSKRSIPPPQPPMMKQLSSKQ